jgi:hypothetical protein
MSEELKPCPFCGKPARKAWDTISCSDEMCQQYYVLLLGKDTWNARPLEEALQVEIDRLRAENETFRERLSLIYGLTYDRDGLTTAESLGALVDEVCEISQGKYTFEAGTQPEELRGEG